MLVVSSRSIVAAAERQDVDQLARHVVLTTYHSVCDGELPAQAGFDAALDEYRRNFPHVPGSIARHAVAYIIADADQQ